MKYILTIVGTVIILLYSLNASGQRQSWVNLDRFNVDYHHIYDNRIIVNKNDLTRTINANVIISRGWNSSKSTYDSVHYKVEAFFQNGTNTSTKRSLGEITFNNSSFENLSPFFLKEDF